MSLKSNQAVFILFLFISIAIFVNGEDHRANDIKKGGKYNDHFPIGRLLLLFVTYVSDNLNGINILLTTIKDENREMADDIYYFPIPTLTDSIRKNCPPYTSLIDEECRYAGFTKKNDTIPKRSIE